MLLLLQPDETEVIWKSFQNVVFRHRLDFTIRTVIFCSLFMIFHIITHLKLAKLNGLPQPTWSLPQTYKIAADISSGDVEWKKRWCRWCQVDLNTLFFSLQQWLTRSHAEFALNLQSSYTRTYYELDLYLLRYCLQPAWSICGPSFFYQFKNGVFHRWKKFSNGNLLW